MLKWYTEYIAYMGDFRLHIKKRSPSEFEWWITKFGCKMKGGGCEDSLDAAKKKLIEVMDNLEYL
jgi:hypothetical protein